MPFKIMPIGVDEYRDWILKKHYAKRMARVVRAFGLFDGSILIGVCCFGSSGNPANNKFMGMEMLELVRLVINDGLPQNTLSWFVSGCLKNLDKPIAVISYADSGQNHRGYIYQATNWLYTGMTTPRDEYEKEDRIYHGKTLHNMYGRGARSSESLQLNGFSAVKTKPKYRYIYILANKAEKKKILKNFPYKILPYPKGDNVKYDTSYSPCVQLRIL